MRRAWCGLCTGGADSSRSAASIAGLVRARGDSLLPHRDLYFRVPIGPSAITSARDSDRAGSYRARVHNLPLPSDSYLSLPLSFPSHKAVAFITTSPHPLQLTSHIQVTFDFSIQNQKWLPRLLLRLPPPPARPRPARLLLRRRRLARRPPLPPVTRRSAPRRGRRPTPPTSTRVSQLDSMIFGV